jgi:hypothetical protein
MTMARGTSFVAKELLQKKVLTQKTLMSNLSHANLQYLEAKVVGLDRLNNNTIILLTTAQYRKSQLKLANNNQSK